MMDVSTHSRPKAADWRNTSAKPTHAVSTHSRPKAAVQPPICQIFRQKSFNTQPPEGGCHRQSQRGFQKATFQHTAARRRLSKPTAPSKQKSRFQHTAARRRLVFLFRGISIMRLFQHTAARRRLLAAVHGVCQRTGFNTQPPEGGCLNNIEQVAEQYVSTHSRPKAAGTKVLMQSHFICFNTQPPEGGCIAGHDDFNFITSFNTQPPEGGWPTLSLSSNILNVSTHSRPKAAVLLMAIQ